MKIPLLPIHVMTTKALQKRLDETATWTRKLSNHQIFVLLQENVKLKNLLAGEKGRKVK